MSRHYYGRIKDSYDGRDYKLSPPLHATLDLPKKVSWRSRIKSVLNQGQLGSCTGNAIAGLFRCSLAQQGLADYVPSRLFIYYLERAMEGTVNRDAGAMIRDGMKVISKYGAPNEELWPYDISQFRRHPSAAAYADGLNHQALEYQSLDVSLPAIKACIASGQPFVFGFDVYAGFESQECARTGQVPMPSRGERPLGGHAVLCLGYDDDKQCIEGPNSWGDNWGDNGFFWMPYDYIANPNLCSDFWLLTLVEGGISWGLMP